MVFVFLDVPWTKSNLKEQYSILEIKLRCTDTLKTSYMYFLVYYIVYLTWPLGNFHFHLCLEE